MKQKLLSIIYVLVSIIVIAFAAKELIFHFEQQRIRFEFATTVVKKQCLQHIYEAEKEKNIHKLMYYKYQYQNAGKLVMELGADTIIQNFANKKTR